jgi:hypothetical protein
LHAQNFPGKYLGTMGKSLFQESLKALEADIQYANTLYVFLNSHPFLRVCFLIENLAYETYKLFFWIP